MQEKKSKGLLITLIIIIVSLLGLSGYLIYDRLSNNEESNNVKQEVNQNKDQNKDINSNDNNSIQQISLLVQLKDIIKKNNQNINVQVNGNDFKCVYKEYTFNYQYENDYLAFVDNATDKTTDYDNALDDVIKEITLSVGEMLNINRSDVEGFLGAGDLEASEDFGYIYKLDSNDKLIEFAISLKDFHI